MKLILKSRDFQVIHEENYAGAPPDLMLHGAIFYVRQGVADGVATYIVASLYEPVAGEHGAAPNPAAPAKASQRPVEHRPKTKQKKVRA